MKISKFTRIVCIENEVSLEIFSDFPILPEQLTNVVLLSPVSDGDPIKLPENLETLPRAEHFPTQRHRWNTNEVSKRGNKK